MEDWLSVFTGRSTDLLPFEQVRQKLRLQDSSYKGLQEIELDKIVGSVGRYRDFTRTFLPKNVAVEQRWRNIDDVAHEQGFPPIEVYQVGEVYFVRDGNHRVSVSRAHDLTWIEAYVTEYQTSIPIEASDDMDTLLLKLGQTDFLAETHLDTLRPDHGIYLTEPGRYRLLKEHIAFHKYLKTQERGSELTDQEAVESWYDEVYDPIVELIRKQEILYHFPERTETDLYAWLLLHRAKLEAEVEDLGHLSDEALLEDLKWEKASNPLTRLLGLFHHKTDLASLSLQIERTKFLEETQLDQIRSNHGIEFSEPGCYRLVKEHIDVHKYFKETELNREVPYQEAVESWYDHVYLPVIELVRQKKAIQHFPNHTEADLYLMSVTRRASLENEQQAMDQALTEKIIDDLEREHPINPIMRLATFLSEKLHLQRMLMAF